MYHLHIGNKNYSSWSLRPWVLMKVLEIPFTETLHHFDEASNFQRFRTFSPTGRVPCLIVNNEPIWDSLAIAEYLAEHHSSVWPEEEKARRFARCAAAEMHSGFGQLREQCSMSCGLRVTLNHIGHSLQRDVSRLDELWQSGLLQFGGPFLAGKQFSAVDAFFCPVAFRWQTYGFPLSEASTAYARRLLDLPAMQQWYANAITETFRDQAHEDDWAKHGRLLHDYRAR